MISIYMSSNRPQLWKQFHKQFASNKTEFEIVAVGDVAPDFSLPSNFKFIYSRTKPSQCFFIAATQTTGETLLNCPDDLQITGGCLDIASETIKDYNPKETMFLLNFSRGLRFVKFSDGRHTYLPTGQMCAREIFFKYGIDRNFLGLYWDRDLALQFASDRGAIVILHECIATEIIPKAHLSQYNKKHDKQFFVDMWKNPDGTYNNVRKQPIDPILLTPSILTISQGTTNSKWD